MPNLHNNWLKPDTYGFKATGSDKRRYRIKLFENLDPALLEDDFNAWIEGRASDGLPWPHLVSTEFNTNILTMGPNNGEPLYSFCVTYLLVGD